MDGTVSAFVHVRKSSTGLYENHPMMLRHIPRVGEYVAMASDGDWYVVQTVVYSLFAGADYGVEIYALRVDPGAVVR